MILFLVSILFLLLHIIFYNSVKINRILIVFACFLICFVYISLAANSTNPKYFYPKKQLQIYPFTGNYYNWLTFNLTQFRLDLDVDKNFVNYLTDGIDKNLLQSNNIDVYVKNFYDASIYKNKVYLYFGITPILLFYLPFYLVTGYFLSDHFVVLFSSLFIFLLQILIYKRISKLLNKNKTLTVVPVLIFGLCSGIILTYISITIHLIPIIISIFCSLVAIYFFLLLFDDKYSNIKMFFIGLFLALAVGARPASIFLLILIFVLLLYNFNIKRYWKQYLCFIIPVIFYGTVLALYNYLRFDSIFDFGIKHQFSPNYMMNIPKSFYFIIQHLFYNIFHFPNFFTTNPYVIFNNASINHFEPCVGGFIVAPTILANLFVFNKFNLLYEYKKVFLLFAGTFFISFIYLLVNSYYGSTARYIAEYLFLLLVPSLTLFYLFVENINNDKLKNILTILFYIFVVFSLYVNTNLIGCIFLMSKNGLI